MHKLFSHGYTGLTLLGHLMMGFVRYTQIQFQEIKVGQGNTNIIYNNNLTI